MWVCNHPCLEGFKCGSIPPWVLDHFPATQLASVVDVQVGMDGMLFCTDFSFFNVLLPLHSFSFKINSFPPIINSDLFTSYSFKSLPAQVQVSQVLLPHKAGPITQSLSAFATCPNVYTQSLFPTSFPISPHLAMPWFKFTDNTLFFPNSHSFKAPPCLFLWWLH